MQHAAHLSRKEPLRVPAFEQVLERFSGLRMNVEIKGWHPLSDEKIAQEFAVWLRNTR
jgi:hypothetical protein